MADEDDSVAADYYRLGVAEDGEGSAKAFRLDTVANAEFELCSTYPARLVVPSKATPELMRARCVRAATCTLEGKYRTHLMCCASCVAMAAAPCLH